jgi:hypothetical protein
MKKPTCLLVSLLGFLAATAILGQEPTPAPLKVLFIGNSYTGVNDLPAMVEATARAAGGRKIETDRRIVGGCTFERHVKETGAIDKIREKKWDVVVLQEQSLRPLIERPLMFEYARILHREIKQQGAEAVFYLTWARQHIPEMQEGAVLDGSPKYAEKMYQVSRPSKTIDLETWRKECEPGLAGGLNGAYLGIAQELNAGVAPVGMAWKKALQTDPTRVLHQPDKSHPNPAGTYLAACVFYATLLNKSPVGLPARIENGDKVLADLPADEACLLQAIAWKTVEEMAQRNKRTD